MTPNPTLTLAESNEMEHENQGYFFFGWAPSQKNYFPVVAFFRKTETADRFVIARRAQGGLDFFFFGDFFFGWGPIKNFFFPDKKR